MLKIYLKTIKHIIQDKDEEYTAYYKSRYVIEEEDGVRSSTSELSIYDDNIENVGYWYVATKKKQGFKVVVDTEDGLLTFKQWKDPDVKLIKTINYKEQSCSMNHLFDLPADKVIAYLKQEGVNLLVSP